MLGTILNRNSRFKSCLYSHMEAELGGVRSSMIFMKPKLSSIPQFYIQFYQKWTQLKLCDFFHTVEVSGSWIPTTLTRGLIVKQRSQKGTLAYHLGRPMVGVGSVSVLKRSLCHHILVVNFSFLKLVLKFG